MTPNSLINRALLGESVKSLVTEVQLWDLLSDKNKRDMGDILEPPHKQNAITRYLEPFVKRITSLSYDELLEAIQGAMRAGRWGEKRRKRSLYKIRNHSTKELSSYLLEFYFSGEGLAL